MNLIGPEHEIYARAFIGLLRDYAGRARVNANTAQAESYPPGTKARGLANNTAVLWRNTAHDMAALADRIEHAAGYLKKETEL